MNETRFQVDVFPDDLCALTVHMLKKLVTFRIAICTLLAILMLLTILLIREVTDFGDGTAILFGIGSVLIVMTLVFAIAYGIMYCASLELPTHVNVHEIVINADGLTVNNGGAVVSFAWHSVEPLNITRTHIILLFGPFGFAWNKNRFKPPQLASAFIREFNERRTMSQVGAPGMGLQSEPRQ